MSVDSTSSSSSPQVSTFKNSLEVYLQPTKSLQPKSSQNDHYHPARHSINIASRDSSQHQQPQQQQQQQQSSSRTRTMSASEETSADTVAELTTMPSYANKHSNKRDRRSSDLKTPVEHHDNTAVDRRNSTPQVYLNALFSHGFRNAKHHHKTNTKEEGNANQMTSNNMQTSNTAPSTHNSDTATIKTDTSSMSSKMPPTISNGLRLVTSQSNDRLPSLQTESISGQYAFVCDEYTSELRSTESSIFESHAPLRVSDTYRNYFHDHFHVNFYGEFESEGPFLVSLRFITQKTPLTNECVARAIIRTSSRNYDIMETVNNTNEHNILQVLFNKINFSQIYHYGAVGDPKANEKLYLFDKTNDDRYNCKVGVIYQSSNQIDEFEIFSNDLISSELKFFLDSISKQVSLKGFSKFRGDLDTTNDLHGEYSYYTVYENHEIMFNVAPMIPSSKANGQCIERKSLTGNAFVCIVFQEQGAIFSPDFIAGRVARIYIVVQPITYEEQLYYKIEIWRRKDIVSKIDPPGGVYRFDQSFTSFFLTLLLNALNAAIESPSLRTRTYEQRQRLKLEELKKLLHTFSLGPIPDLNNDFDHNQHFLDARPNIRSESFAGTTSTGSNENTNATSGRTSPVSSKKRGFSKKIFGVFSSRSGSVSSTVSNSTTNTNDTSVSNPQQSSSASVSDASITSGRTSTCTNREPVKRSSSTKSSKAPVAPTRTNNSVPLQTISVQPPSPSVTPTNSFPSDKPPSSRTSTIDEENRFAYSTNEDAEESKDESSDEEDSIFNHPPQSSPNQTSSYGTYMS